MSFRESRTSHTYEVLFPTHALDIVLIDIVLLMSIAATDSLETNILHLEDCWLQLGTVCTNGKDPLLFAEATVPHRKQPRLIFLSAAHHALTKWASLFRKTHYIDAIGKLLWQNALQKILATN